MGVYNPQMKMPIGCHLCDYYDICKTSNKSIGRYNGERCPDCPLVEVKTPHGGLIDADELWEHIGRDRLDSRELIMKMVDNAPTVIECEVE